MTKPQSILAATDFSPDGQRAAMRAAMIAADMGISQGAVLHVIDSSWLDTLMHYVQLADDTTQALVDDALQSLRELVEEVRDRTGFELDPQVRQGAVLDTLLAQLEQVDLLTLGARGTHTLSEFTLGSMAQRIIRRTNKSVLVVDPAPVTPYQRVLIGVDFSAHSHRAFSLSRAIAPHAQHRLVHVYDVPFEGKMSFAGTHASILQEYREKAQQAAEEEMERFVLSLGADGKDVLRTVQHGIHVPTKLREIIQETKADLFVIGKHGKTLAEHLLIGSVTIHLLAECPCDVLVTQ